MECSTNMFTPVFFAILFTSLVLMFIMENTNLLLQIEVLFQR
jgi:hypothetical protein